MRGRRCPRAWEPRRGDPSRPLRLHPTPALGGGVSPPPPLLPQRPPAGPGRSPSPEKGPRPRRCMVLGAGERSLAPGVPRRVHGKPSSPPRPAPLTKQKDKSKQKKIQKKKPKKKKPQSSLFPDLHGFLPLEVPCLGDGARAWARRAACPLWSRRRRERRRPRERMYFYP